MRHSPAPCAWDRWRKALPLASTVLLASVSVSASQDTPAAARSSKTPLSRSVEALKAAGGDFRTIRLFKEETTPAVDHSALRALVSEGLLLRLDNPEVKSLLTRDTRHFTLPIPGRGALELVQVDYSHLRVEGAHGEDLSSTNTAKHYQGILKGDDRSLAALSVFRNLQTGAYEIAGVYSTRAEGNAVIGRLKGPNPSNEHLVYLESAVRDRPPMVECGVNADGADPQQAVPLEDALPSDAATSAASAAPSPRTALARCVRLHFEVEYDVYQAQGANTTNYATTFFNISRTIYANEGIPLNLNYLRIWTSPDPEANISGYQNIWNHFWNRMYAEGIKGDIAMLAGVHVDRGIAALNPICGPDYNQAGISPIRDYPAYPTYSWASATFPHEIGHLFGSPHTQACYWNGNSTALDGCAAPEGSCARPSSTYGTIMSYCSNFSLVQGFGTQPGNLIRNSFNTGTCVVDCGGTGCTYTITPTSASVGAGGGSGTVNVTTSPSDCTWTSSSAATWITITAGGGTRTGSGSISYSVTANTGTAPRSGTITIADRAFTVSQSGAATGGTALSNGVAVSVSGAAGSQNLYYIDVPSGSTDLAMATTGGTGDVDLYTKVGSPPTTTSYDCRPYTSGNNETCRVATPSAGRYYIMLHGYAAYSGAALRASFTTSTSSPPTITTQPVSRTVSVGQTATFSVVASGTAPLSYQWYKNGAAIGGANASSYTTPPAGTADNGASFYVSVVNAYGGVSSSTVTLTVTSGGTTVRVLSPNGGESWTRGSTHAITWAATNSQHVDVALYRGTTFVQWITWYVVSSAGSYNWTLPTSLTAGSNYTVRILDYDQRTISDSSDSTFTIN